MRLDRVSATVNGNSILRCSLAFSQNLSKEISNLDPEVARVTDDGIKLVKSENIVGDLEEKLVQDINDIEERYEKLKKSSSDDVKRYCVWHNNKSVHVYPSHRKLFSQQAFEFLSQTGGRNFSERIWKEGEAWKMEGSYWKNISD